MEFFKRQTTIDFMKQRRLAAIFSAIVFVVSIVSLFINGLNLGLDFTGGTQIIAKLPQQSITDIRSVLKASGYSEVVVQPYETAHEFMIRVPDRAKDKNHPFVKELQHFFPVIHVLSADYIGPQVGKTLMTNGVLAILVSLVATMLYIMIRFDYRFSVSAAVALIHDPILILGLFSLFQIPFDLITLAAILTIIGYSLNDTVVVYDRVRENFIKMDKMDSTAIMNLSINGTLSRTIMTSGLTLLVVLALLMFGGKTLFGFSLALTIGIVIGTYSSIYVAGALAVMMGLKREHLVSEPKPATKNLV